jgi:dTDP-4-amino-4,6-dideoxygalactose transaminase
VKRNSKNNQFRVPFFKPHITVDDRKAVLSSLNQFLLTDGPRLKEFESNFAKFVGSRFAVGVSNATSALHMSLKALGVKDGDEVIVPDITFVATANAVLLSGATPILADVNIDDYNISISSIKKNITTKTKAIIPVHMAGKSCDMNEIRKIANKFNVFVIEDCAHALGTKFGNKHVGTFGDIGCFSFYPTKNITTIEGGMIVCNNQKIEQYIRRARSHGINRSLAQRYGSGIPWEYDIEEPGYNYRLDEIRSALGLSQLRRIKKINQLRLNAVRYYNNRLKKIAGIVTPEFSNYSKDSHHLYIIRITEKFGMTRTELFKKLLGDGISTTVHYKPLHEFSIFKKLAKTYDSLENSAKLYSELLSLPLFPTITRKEQNSVIESIIRYKKTVKTN